MPHVDISEDIALERLRLNATTGESDYAPTEFGTRVLDFVATHFDLRPLTTHAVHAITDQGQDSAEKGFSKMNYKPEFHFATGERQTNAQVFATKGEAEASAKRSFAEASVSPLVRPKPTDWGTVETTDLVTYRWDDITGDTPCSVN
ncbi:MAG: hypothetical protein ABGX63_02535 [bacterium]